MRQERERQSERDKKEEQWRACWHQKTPYINIDIKMQYEILNL